MLLLISGQALNVNDFDTRAMQAHIAGTCSVRLIAAAGEVFGDCVVIKVIIS